MHNRDVKAVPRHEKGPRERGLSIAGAGFVHHSDQGSQYVSLRSGERCPEIGIHCSMGSTGDFFDNAAA